MTIETTEQHLPSDAAARKARPIATGVLDYFPDALAEVAYVSKVGNEQHSPGQPMRWDKSKSKDEADCLLRHLIDRGKLDTDGLRHTAKVAWRALALLQREIESERPAGEIHADVCRPGVFFFQQFPPGDRPSDFAEESLAV